MADGAEQIGPIAAAWMRYGAFLERQGLPFLCSVVLTVILLPFCYLRVFQEVWKEYFVLPPPKWHMFSTCVFVVSFALGLLIQKFRRVSWHSVLIASRKLKRLEAEGVVTRGQRSHAIQLLLANCILHRMRDNIERTDKIEAVLETPAFKKALKKIPP